MDPRKRNYLIVYEAKRPRLNLPQHPLHLLPVCPGPHNTLYRVFLLRRDLSPAAFIRFDPDEGDRYEITGIHDFRSGQSPHLEVEVRRIVSEGLVTSGATS